LYGRIVFGASAVLFGVIALMWHDSDTWQNLQQIWRFAFGTLIGGCLMAALIAGGIGMQYPRTARLASKRTREGRAQNQERRLLCVLGRQRAFLNLLNDFHRVAELLFVHTRSWSFTHNQYEERALRRDSYFAYGTIARLQVVRTNRPEDQKSGVRFSFRLLFSFFLLGFGIGQPVVWAAIPGHDRPVENVATHLRSLLKGFRAAVEEESQIRVHRVRKKNPAARCPQN
jgi:hypothetical protein